MGAGRKPRGAGKGRYRRERRACAAPLTCCREAVERYSFKLMRTPDTEIKAVSTKIHPRFLPFQLESWLSCKVGEISSGDEHSGNMAS